MKTFRWTVPEPNHPPIPPGGRVYAKEKAELAALAQRLDLNQEEERTLLKHLRGYSSVWWTAIAQVSVALFIFWTGPLRTAQSEAPQGPTNAALLIGILLLILGASTVADGLRRRKLKALLEKIALARTQTDPKQTQHAHDR